MRNHLKSLAIIAVFIASSFVGVKGTAAALMPQPSGSPTALWIGDSYTFGAGVSEPWVYGEGWAVSANLGWSYHLDAQGGTGYIATGFPGMGFSPVPNRLAADTAYQDDYVVLDAGRNDLGASWSQLSQVVTTYFADLSKDFPTSQVIVVAPSAMWVTDPSTYLQLRCLEASLSAQYHFWYIDPMSLGWITPQVNTMVGPDGAHPNEQGYLYLDGQLTSAFRQMISDQFGYGPPALCGG